MAAKTPRRSLTQRLDFPRAVLDRGFTVIPNELDRLGLDAESYRVLVCILRWLGTTTVERPLIKVGIGYIARTTGLGETTVKDRIKRLETHYHLISVIRRRHAVNMYDVRPLFTVLLQRLAQPTVRSRASSADDSGTGSSHDDLDEVMRDFEERHAEEHPARGWGKPSYGLFEDLPCSEEGLDIDHLIEEDQIREALERGEYIPGKVAEVVFEGARSFVRVETLRALQRAGETVFVVRQ